MRSLIPARRLPLLRPSSRLFSSRPSFRSPYSPYRPSRLERAYGWWQDRPLMKSVEYRWIAAVPAAGVLFAYFVGFHRRDEQEPQAERVCPFTAVVRQLSLRELGKRAKDAASPVLAPSGGARDGETKADGDFFTPSSAYFTAPTPIVSPTWIAGEPLVPCNSTLEALVQSAVGLDNRDLSFEQIFAAGDCYFTSENTTLVKEAREVWITGSSYGYIPSSGFAIFALVAFGLSTAVHLYQLYRSRRWTYIAAILGAVLQMAGWGMRYSGSSIENILNGYVGQLAVLTIAPTFFSAVIYALFSTLAASEDPSLLFGMGPKGYMITFIVIDFTTLVIQAAGGGLAATTDIRSTFDAGCNVMLAGIILQLITTLVFMTAFGIYYHRLRQTKGDALSLREGSGRIFWGTVVMAVFIVLRGCYRTAELSEGLFGAIAKDEGALIGCDAIPMIFVAFLLNATHPLHNIKAPARTPSYGMSNANSQEKVGTAVSVDRV
ncbi:hypothetical protein JCM8097_001343 [Rhodosporidiobolus ruineniae]